MTSSEKYFTGEVLGVSSGLEIFGNIQGNLVIALALTWGAVAACLAAGVRHTGKVNLCHERKSQMQSNDLSLHLYKR